jgi:hypothetical protein
MPKRTESARPVSASRDQRKPPAQTTSPEAEELSAYELLERRSVELAEERAHGGFGTPQPPHADVPLLYPKPRGDRPQAGAPSGTPAPRRRPSRQTKKKG